MVSVMIFEDKHPYFTSCLLIVFNAHLAKCLNLESAEEWHPQGSYETSSRNCSVPLWSKFDFEYISYDKSLILRIINESSVEKKSSGCLVFSNRV